MHGREERGELQAEQDERRAVEPRYTSRPQMAKALWRVSTSMRTGSRQPEYRPAATTESTPEKPRCSAARYAA